ncbi:hypothetical protein OC844_007842, partial [Tilletia horrida]
SSVIWDKLKQHNKDFAFPVDCTESRAEHEESKVIQALLNTKLLAGELCLVQHRAKQPSRARNGNA